MKKLKNSIFFLFFFYSSTLLMMSEPHSYRSIITTGLNSDEDPINSITSVNFTKKIYIYNRWTDLAPEQEYECRVKFYDGSGQMVYDDSMTFSSDSVSYYTWFYYKPLSNIDKIGKWKIEIFLDGKRMTTCYLTVNPPKILDRFYSWKAALILAGSFLLFIILLSFGLFFLKRLTTHKTQSKAPPILPVH